MLERVVSLPTMILTLIEMIDGTTLLRMKVDLYAQDQWLSVLVGIKTAYTDFLETHVWVYFSNSESTSESIKNIQVKIL